MQLPTDTAHLRPQTRQYELFGKPLGQGIERRKIWVGAGFALAWWGFLLLVGLSPLDLLGPLAWIVPVAVVTILGTRTGEDGRMALMRGYDWLLSRRRSRHRVLRNPLVPAASRTPALLQITAHTAVRPYVSRENT